MESRGEFFYLSERGLNSMIKSVLAQSLTHQKPSFRAMQCYSTKQRWARASFSLSCYRYSRFLIKKILRASRYCAILWKKIKAYLLSSFSSFSSYR